MQILFEANIMRVCVKFVYIRIEKKLINYIRFLIYWLPKCNKYRGVEQSGSSSGS